VCKSNRSGQAKVFTAEQLELFLAQLNEKYALLAEVLYYSAGRVGEISQLRVRNINIAEELIVIEKSLTKTKVSRTVPMHPRVISDLKKWIAQHNLDKDDFVFFTQSRNMPHLKKGEKSVGTAMIDRAFRTAFDFAGMKGFSTHSFRRSRLTHLLKMGWHLREIMDISDHKTLASLQKYLDSDRDETHSKYRDLMKQEH
jgi:integrase/recombinase XerD